MFPELAEQNIIPKSYRKNLSRSVDSKISKDSKILMNQTFQDKMKDTLNFILTHKFNTINRAPKDSNLESKNIVQKNKSKNKFI